jgi:hypothetical protein
MKEELYVKDDKRVLIVGGTHYGKSYALEMLKRAMIEQGYTGTPITPSSPTETYWFLDEMEQPCTN